MCTQIGRQVMTSCTNKQTQQWKALLINGGLMQMNFCATFESSLWALQPTCSRCPRCDSEDLVSVMIYKRVIYYALKRSGGKDRSPAEGWACSALVQMLSIQPLSCICSGWQYIYYLSLLGPLKSQQHLCRFKSCVCLVLSNCQGVAITFKTDKRS